MTIVFFFTYHLLLLSCSTGPASTATAPDSVFINSTADLGGCKYLGIAQTNSNEDWKKQLRQQAGEKGATHIQTSGPNGVTGSQYGETINANLYFCKKDSVKN